MASLVVAWWQLGREPAAETVAVTVETSAAAGQAQAQTTVQGAAPAAEAETTPKPSTQEENTARGSASDLRAVLRDVEAFWTRELPNTFRRQYENVDPSRVIGAMSADDTAGVTCDGEEIGVIEENAFAAACDEGYLIVWDAFGLTPRLSQKYGSVAPTIVLSHEWGHIAQYQARVRMANVYLEQQADCFAGAWFVGARDRFADLHDPSALDGALGALIDFRDSPGFDAGEPGTHGNGFDRVRAFQEGYERGVAFCARYEENPPTMTEVGFSTQAELDSGGNLAFDEAVTLAETALNKSFAAAVNGFPTLRVVELSGSAEVECDGKRLSARTLGAYTKRCGDDRVLVDADSLASLHRAVGDAATLVMLALEWSSQAQETLGQTSDGGDSGAFLQQSCLSGAFIADSTTTDITLSPGDLDEAVILFTQQARNGGLAAGESFQAVASLRQGFEGGYRACELPGG